MDGAVEAWTVGGWPCHVRELVSKEVVSTGAVGSGGAGEVKSVAAHSNADTVHFGFSWSHGGNHLGVGYFTFMRDS